MTAQWPQSHSDHYDESIEEQFSQFQEVVTAIRKIRASQNIPPKESVPVAIRCTAASQALLEPMSVYFGSLAGADVMAIGPDAKPFETDAPMALTSIDIDVHVDLEKFIDMDAELARLEKQEQQLVKQIGGKEGKLSNENFVARAPEDVVAKERESLEDLKRQLEKVRADIARLRKKME